ncbi:MAG: hypothetical protein KUL83_04430 [Lentimicrobium sp.]|jgi:hypothetical protein|nr:hypothetical protein [Lentimicrobium sp.]MDY0024406.1 hypothetical protein [Lentimicrobium sp.]
MKKIIFIIIALVVSMTYAFGQSVSDSISARKVFGGYRFYQGDQRLNFYQLENIMKQDELAYQQIVAAKSTNSVSTVIGGIGGFMVGWTIGTAIGGGDPNWILAGMGAGLIVISIPITNSTIKKTKQAVDTYNAGLQASSLVNKWDFKFSMTGNGIGVILCF